MGERSGKREVRVGFVVFVGVGSELTVALTGDVDGVGMWVLDEENVWLSFVCEGRGVRRLRCLNW